MKINIDNIIDYIITKNKIKEIDVYHLAGEFIINNRITSKELNKLKHELLFYEDNSINRNIIRFYLLDFFTMILDINNSKSFVFHNKEIEKSLIDTSIAIKFYEC